MGINNNGGHASVIEKKDNSITLEQDTCAARKLLNWGHD